MWSIRDVGVEAVQLVRTVRSRYASVRKRLGLFYPIWFAHWRRAGWAPPLSVLVQLELMSHHEYGLVCGVPLIFVHLTHDENSGVGKCVCLFQVWEVF